MKKSLFFAEMLGTSLLIYIGAGAVALNASLVEIAFAHGLVVIAFAYAYGYLSGTHINPAVSLAFLLLNRISFKEAIFYFSAQFIGGCLGAIALKFSLLNTNIYGLGETALVMGLIPIQGVFIEAALTFILVNTVLHCALKEKAGNLAGATIGFSLVAAILMGGPLTGASLNPARSFGPALINLNFTHLWVYFVGPFLGSAVAVVLFKWVLLEKK